MAQKPVAKVKDARKFCQQPLGAKTTDVVYQIPCTCDENVYTGETFRKFETRKYEHRMKVRKTQDGVEKGDQRSTEMRMNTEWGFITAKYRV